jgi:hypothetical protein
MAPHSRQSACGLSNQIGYWSRVTITDTAMPITVLERRQSECLAVRTSVKIIHGHFAPLDCIATNVSDGGAQIHIRNVELPDVFTQHFTATGRKRQCRVVWRQGAEMGVAFTDRPQVNFGRRVASRVP